MTNRIELNWKLDGFVDEQRYYCSEIPIDPLNLPTPKAVLAGDARGCIDTEIETGKTYYIVVSSVRNSVEKLSHSVTIVTDNYEKYTAFFKLDNLLDKKGGASLIPKGTAIISSGAAYFDGAESWLERPDTSATTFSDDLTLECEFKCARIGVHSNYQTLIDNFHYEGWQIGLTPNGSVYLYFNNPNVYPIVSPNLYSDGNWHKLKWTRNKGLNCLFVNDVLVGTYNDSRQFSTQRYVAIGAQVANRNSNYDFKGWIKNVGYSKQVL